MRFRCFIAVMSILIRSFGFVCFITYFTILLVYYTRGRPVQFNIKNPVYSNYAIVAISTKIYYDLTRQKHPIRIKITDFVCVDFFFNTKRLSVPIRSIKINAQFY